jgi:hypothetical protein
MAAPEAKKHVCVDCIDDFVVKAEIEADGKRRKCSYCGDKGTCLPVEAIAERVEEVYLQFVSQAEHTAYFPDDSDKVEYRQNGSTPNVLICEMLECDDDAIADDVVKILSARNSYTAIKDGDTDWFDDSNDVFELSIPKSKEVAATWQAFCESVKHDRRFFNEIATSLLAEILEPIVNPKREGEKSAVRTIEPAGAERFIYRGRMANTVAARSEILAKPINALGAPPRHVHNIGRMNAAGIPVFYGSFDIETCMAELRGPVGGTAVVGKFEILRPLRVLDLTLLQNAMFNISYFDEDVIRKFAFNRFLRGFHKEIKKAIIPGSETLDYLPTQFVAEYLWTKVSPRLDGLIFGSAQISKSKAKNIVLFPHASMVGGCQEELHPKTKAAAKPKPELELEAGLSNIFAIDALEDAPVEVSAPEPVLRLVPDGTVIADVRSIRYKLKTRSVSLYESEMEHGVYEDEEDYEEDEDDDEDDDDDDQTESPLSGS